MEFVQIVRSGTDVSPKAEALIEKLQMILSDLAAELFRTCNYVDIRVSISAE